MSQLYGVFVILVLSIITVIESKAAEVRFVNVVFRHGDRAPDDNGKELYPTDPYLHEKFFPTGLGGLTNNGKIRLFEFGKILRQRYDDFLGSIYLPEDIDARSTNYKRTKMSLSVLLASLYPPAPVQKWHPVLNWQPIPFTYVLDADDVLLIPEECPRYLEEFERVKSLPEVVEKLEKFRPFMNNLTILTGKRFNNTNDMFYLYHNLMAESSMGLKLPDWTNEIFPNGTLFDGTALEYEIVHYNDLLKRLNGGALLKRFSDDMISTVKGTAKKARKINLFSGHETNVAALLNTLGVYKPHVPEYGSAVIVELLQENNNYFVKVLHYLGIPATIEEITIPGCSLLCPLEHFLKLLKKVTPTDEELVCPKASTLFHLS